MPAFDQAFAHTVGLEGAYSDNPNDRGGPTMYGITMATARDNGYTGDMRALPLDIAKAIYRRRFWDSIQLDRIAAVSERLAIELFDTGVNMGPPVAVQFLQDCLNAFNRQGKLYPDVTPDGVMGPSTISALRAYYATRSAQGQSVLLKALNCLQGARYLELSQKRQANEEFVFGWINARVEV